MPPDPPTAFFSYSREDSEFALRLAEDLKAAGADVWLDQLDIAPGQRWARAVQEALQDSPRVLVILSPASVSSNHVEDEVNFALDEQKTVIPVFYRDCKVPFRLRPLQYVDFRTDYAHGLEIMLKTLSMKQQSAAGPAAAPTGPRASPPTATHAEVSGKASERQLFAIRKAVWPPPPQKPGLFVGREEGLEELRQRLGVDKNNRAGRKPPAIAMFGLPGVGKTTLAAELTWDAQIRNAFPDGTLWTTVGEASERATLGQWGAALGKDGEKIAGAVTATAAWTELGKVLKDRRMLLVVDDVWELKQAIGFKEILGPRCGLVITSRDRRLAMDLADEPEKHAYELPELTDEAGLELLRTLARSVVESYQQKCLELVKDLGKLPLALQVAGRLLDEENKKDPALAEKLLDELRAGKKLLDANVPADRRSRQDKTAPTVAALLKRSTDRLDKTTRERFAALGPSHRPAIFSPDTLKDTWHVRDPQPTIDALINHGLLEPLGNGKYQMHAVLVSFANSLLRASAKTMKPGRRK